MSHVRQLSDAEAGKARERPVKKVCPAIDGVVCGWGFGHNRGRETGRGLLRRPRPFAEGRRARTGAHERGLCLTWADALLLRPTPTAASCTARPSAWECLSCRCRFPSMGRNVSKASTWMWSGSTGASATAATSSRRSRPSRRWANCGRNCCRNTTRWSISLCRAVFRVRARRPARLAEHFEGRVFVVDNQRISVTQRESVLDALAWVREGRSAAEVRDLLEADALEASIYLMVDTMEHLRRGGRVTPAAAAIGSVLRIKPVLQIQGSKLDAFSVAKSERMARRTMLRGHCQRRGRAIRRFPERPPVRGPHELRRDGPRVRRRGGSALRRPRRVRGCPAARASPATWVQARSASAALAGVACDNSLRAGCCGGGSENGLRFLPLKGLSLRFSFLAFDTAALREGLGRLGCRQQPLFALQGSSR